MIYICIPTHNEQQTVGVVLWKLRQVLTEFHRDYQLLVADDASTDKTTDVLEPYTRVLPLTVIRSEQRQGYAASLEMLLREAVRRSEYPKRDVIVTLQADFSEEPDDIVGLIKRMEAGADVAAGIKVGAGREPRVRRLARTLSAFFARKQSWPEGVVTPFDGYRAYRLYAVKRALEDCGARRLLRYDGWAGHAELLRAVLPHARRIETLNVEDRADRLQRPRRERPLAAAWQVRAMVNGTEPDGLASVEELDRVAATASRSRDRAALNGTTRAPARQGTRDRRPNGEGGRSGGRPDGRERGRPERRPERGERRDRHDRSASGERTGPAQPRGERRPDNRGERPERGERPARQRGEAGSDEQRRRRRPEPQAAAPADETLDAVINGGEETEGAAPKKRRRRRRGRGGSAAAQAGASGADDAPADDAERRAALNELDALLGDLAERNDPESGQADAEAGGDEDAADGAPTERKKRRRGGRRGGRGRRRSTRPDGADGPAGESPTEPGAQAGPDGGTGRAAGNIEPPRVAGLLAPPQSRNEQGPEQD